MRYPFTNVSFVLLTVSVPIRRHKIELTLVRCLNILTLNLVRGWPIHQSPLRAPKSRWASRHGRQRPAIVYRHRPSSFCQIAVCRDCFGTKTTNKRQFIAIILTLQTPQSPIQSSLAMRWMSDQVFCINRRNYHSLVKLMSWVWPVTIAWRPHLKGGQRRCWIFERALDHNSSQLDATQMYCSHLVFLAKKLSFTLQSRTSMGGTRLHCLLRHNHMSKYGDTHNKWVIR